MKSVYLASSQKDPCYPRSSLISVAVAMAMELGLPNFHARCHDVAINSVHVVRLEVALPANDGRLPDPFAASETRSWDRHSTDESRLKRKLIV